MYIPSTPIVYTITNVSIEVYLQCFTDSVSQIELGKSTSLSEKRSVNSVCFKAKKSPHYPKLIVILVMT